MSLTSTRVHSPRVLWLTVPSLVWFAVFSVGPLAAMFVIATLRWKGLLYEPTYIGLENIGRVFADPTFHAAVRNSVIQVAIAIPVMIPLAFMLGYHLTTKPRGYRILSVLYFSPGLISISMTGMIFYGVLSPNGGVNGLLRGIGLDSWATAWLADPSTALPSLIAIDLWRGIGWTAVLFAARLASLPAEVIEAAQIDGAGRMRIMWRIAFPMVKDYVRTLAMLQFLWTLFTSAALILLLTKGGPGTSSTTLSYLVYAKAFSQRDLGYSQVVGVVLLLLGVAGMLLIRALLRGSEKDFR
ncbi:carbohydrate ABC transporter permease [Streptosporangium sp. 'caverna']|jgi:ABC-type sugar transport system permease subunit|uniref:carbohydrate ABC transporter permease n=1 Tax=Streptosporangium sp. 'caverna' TaxID=2202249 RepID=UPI000D7D62B7|nr:sugar ABC transporter permease [Streptosporangium sp. 'caverna']AWS40333.1 transporter [Streptosporangium sp. 'caverna']